MTNQQPTYEQVKAEYQKIFLKYSSMKKKLQKNFEETNNLQKVIIEKDELIREYAKKISDLKIQNNELKNNLEIKKKEYEDLLNFTSADKCNSPIDLTNVREVMAAINKEKRVLMFKLQQSEAENERLKNSSITRNIGNNILDLFSGFGGARNNSSNNDDTCSDVRELKEEISVLKKEIESRDNEILVLKSQIDGDSENAQSSLEFELRIIKEQWELSKNENLKLREEVNALKNTRCIETSNNSETNTLKRDVNLSHEASHGLESNRSNNIIDILGFDNTQTSTGDNNESSHLNSLEDLLFGVNRKSDESSINDLPAITDSHLEEQIKALKLERDELISSLETCSEEVTVKENLINDLKEKLEYEISQSNVLRNQNIDLQKRVEILEQQSPDSHLESEKLKDLVLENNKIQAINNDLTNKFVNMQNDLKQSNNQVNMLRKELDNANEKYRELNDLNQQLSNENNAKKEHIETLIQNNQTLKDAAISLESRIRDLETIIEKSEQKSSEILQKENKNYIDLKSKNAELIEMIKVRTDELSSAHEIINKSNEKISLMASEISNLSSAKAELEVRVENLGITNSNYATELENQAKILDSKVKELNAMQTSYNQAVLNLKKAEYELSRVNEELSETKIELDKQSTLIKEEKHDFEQREVRLESIISSLRETIESGTDKLNNASDEYSALQHSYDELAKDKKLVEEDLKLSMLKIEHLQSDITDRDNRIKELDNELSEERKISNKFNSLKNKYEASKLKQTKLVQKLEQDNKELLDKIKALESDTNSPQITQPEVSPVFPDYIRKVLLQFFLQTGSPREQLIPIILQLVECSDTQIQQAQRCWASNTQVISKAFSIFGR